MAGLVLEMAGVQISCKAVSLPFFTLYRLGVCRVRNHIDFPEKGGEIKDSQWI
jgi:hypothetical protein